MRRRLHTITNYRMYHRARERRSRERLEGMHMCSLPVRLSTQKRLTVRVKALPPVWVRITRRPKEEAAMRCRRDVSGTIVLLPLH